MANEPTPFRSSGTLWRGALAVVCACLLVPGEAVLLAQSAPPADAQKAAAPADAAAKLSADQLDSLVAPIALYPDSLLAQTLAASTYPLEIIQLQQWLAKNPNLKDKALADAVAKQPWDPAVQAMAPLPDVVKRLADDIQWTTDLGNAFLAQQSDVMDAVQRMRKKAQDKGALKTTEQQKVETKVVEQKTVIIVESANPEVVYVPVYSPTVVYPPPVYPYPPIYYPPYPPGAAFVTFTAGVVIGAAIWGGAWGHCGWGHNDIDININNNFNRNTNINTGNIGSGNRGGGNSWSHNSQHRGGTPYPNSATANKYSGSARGGASASQQGRGTAGGASASQQGRGSTGGASASQQGRGSAGGASPSASTASRGGGGASPSASSAGSRGGSGASPSASSASKGGGGFGGGSGGMSGSSARASSSRGASSFSGRSGGGGGGGRRR
ncbi:MAG: DUF3300 domain-containing protein [Thermoanaerobaculia bacterium]